MALAERAKARIKVKQPLAELQVKTKIDKELAELIKEEINVKKITFGKSLKLDTKITSELKEQGMIREIIRQIQEMRKKAGLKPKDKIIVKYSGPDKESLEKNRDIILEQANIEKLTLLDATKKVIVIKKI